MAIALNWRRIRIRSVRRHALRIADGPHIVAFHRHHYPPWINVCGHGEAAVRSIRRRHLSNREESGGQPEDRSPMHGEGALDIGLVLNSFEVVEIAPKIIHCFFFVE